jgi:hypothetical protein
MMLLEAEGFSFEVAERIKLPCYFHCDSLHGNKELRAEFTEPIILLYRFLVLQIYYALLFVFNYIFMNIVLICADTV